MMSRTWNTWWPSWLKIFGCSVVLQTRWRMVVFPALARPIIRTRKRMVNLCACPRCPSISSSAPCNWSGFIIDWDAVPIQDVFKSTLMLPLSHLPNHMQMIPDVFVGWTFLHKVLNFIQFWCSACFKATWVMKDKCHITLESHFILNFMLPSLPYVQ